MPIISNRLRNLIYQANNLKQAVGILFVTVLISNVLGLLRNVIIANRVGLTYGTIGPLDHYYAAFILPDLLYNIVIVGALSSAVLPTLAKIDAEGDEQKFWRTFNVLISTGFVAITLGVVVLLLFLPKLLALLLPGFGQDELAATVKLAQVMLLSPLFFTVSQISTSALQAKKMFLVSALAPIVYNLAIIASALAIPRFGLSILVIGVIVGAVSHWLIQLPALIKIGWRFKFELDFKNDHLNHIIKLMVPRAIALTGNQLLLIFFYQLASQLQTGSISIYTLTDDLQTAPVLLLANTLAMAVLPDFVRHIAKADHHLFEELIGKSMRLIIFMFIPLTGFFIIFRQPIVELYIAIGHSISLTETDLAVRTLLLFVISLFFQGAILLLARGYFAHHDTIRPTIYSVASIILSWLLAMLFVRTTNLAVTGLALAFSIGSTVNALLLWSNLNLPLRILIRDSAGNYNFPLVAIGGLGAWVVFLASRMVLTDLAKFFLLTPSSQNLMVISFGLLLGVLFYWGWSQVFQLEQWQLIRVKRQSGEK